MVDLHGIFLPTKFKVYNASKQFQSLVDNLFSIKMIIKRKHSFNDSRGIMSQNFQNIKENGIHSLRSYPNLYQVG